MQRACDQGGPIRPRLPDDVAQPFAVNLLHAELGWQAVDVSVGGAPVLVDAFDPAIGLSRNAGDRRPVVELDQSRTPSSRTSPSAS
jgi:hypothetical protein